MATPDFSTLLCLTGDEQAELGIHRGSTLAAVAQPVRGSPLASLGTIRIRIPAAGTENDKNPSRIVPRDVSDLSVTEDELYRHEHQQICIHADLVNRTSNEGRYDSLHSFRNSLPPAMIICRSDSLLFLADDWGRQVQRRVRREREMEHGPFA